MEPRSPALQADSLWSEPPGNPLMQWLHNVKEGWGPKNRCFWTAVVEKTRESLGLQGNQPWIFTERTDAEAESLILWPTDAKFSSVTQSRPTLCHQMDCSTTGFPVHHQLSRACSNSCPLSRWCHPTISSSVIPFFCLQYFPASGSCL